MYFIHQYSGNHFFGALLLTLAHHFAQGIAFIKDIVNDQHGAVGHINRRRRLPLQISGTAGFTTVTGGVHVALFQREVELGQQPASGDQATVHDAIHHRHRFFQALGDGRRHGIKRVFHLLFGFQQIGFFHNLVQFFQSQRLAHRITT